MNGDRIIFASTEEDVGIPVQGWTAIYSLNMKTSVVKRLTPPGITDYSPAVSPSGTHLHQLVDFLFVFIFTFKMQSLFDIPKFRQLLL